jgi:hypothetical protein
MHVSVAEYQIRDIDDAGWGACLQRACTGLCAVPGLRVKYWLHGDADIRGGVYIWSDRVAFSRSSTATWAVRWAIIRTSQT